MYTFTSAKSVAYTEHLMVCMGESASSAFICTQAEPSCTCVQFVDIRILALKWNGIEFGKSHKHTRTHTEWRREPSTAKHIAMKRFKPTGTQSSFVCREKGMNHFVRLLVVRTFAAFFRPILCFSSSNWSMSQRERARHSSSNGNQRRWDIWAELETTAKSRKIT